jgi:hypothetical protein
MKVSNIKEWHPCSEAAQLIEICKNIEFTIMDVLTSPILNGYDDWRLWIACREDFFSWRTLIHVEADFAERVLGILNIKEQIYWDTVNTFHEYANGKVTESAYKTAMAEWLTLWEENNKLQSQAYELVNSPEEQSWQVEHLLMIIKSNLNPY